MYGDGKSDGSVVPEKSSNKGSGAPQPAEKAEERLPAKGNPSQQTSHRTQRRVSAATGAGLRPAPKGAEKPPDPTARVRLQQALERIRQAARRDSKEQFTTLWHHVYDVDRLRDAFLSLARKSAPGVDRVTWQAYAENLEDNLRDLAGRLARGGYRAQPVRRVRIPKEDGRERLIGVPALEDKVVQRATVEVLNAIYEVDFLGFSYGFRQGRSQHQALDALTTGIEWKKVSWVLDADIRGFFDAISHDWLVRFVEHRIGDDRVIRHIKKWLKAGVMEDGRWSSSEEGTPQGGSISPLLANVYLHYAFDLWAQAWRERHAHGDVIVVRFADDIVMGFQHRHDAEQFRSELTERLRKFNLELHPEKTRLIEFGRFAELNRTERGEGKPETFDFLGFTHICAKRRNGKFTVLRKTMSKRFRRKLRELRVELQKRLNNAVMEVGKWLGAVMRGWFNYHSIPRNFEALQNFRFRVIRMWREILSRRSQKARAPWEWMNHLAEQYLPMPKILHPYPTERFARRT